MAPKPKVKVKKPGAIHYLFGPGPFASGHSAPPVEGSSRSVSEHEGRVHQPGVPSGPRQTYAPTGPTTVAPLAGPPAPAKPSQPSAPSHVVSRQRSLVKQFVTKAYSQKVSKIRKSAPGYELNDRIGKAKSEVSDLRERLLNHPAVEEANSAGKVVSPTGLAKIHRTEVQRHAIEGPKGVAHSKLFGLEPRSLQVGTKGLKELQGSTGVEGSVARTQAKAKQKAQTASEPSTLEDLGYASIGLPGIGVGGDVAKLAEMAGTGIPKLLAEGGAKQLAKDAGAGIAAKGAAARAGAKGALRLPGEALEGIRAAPGALKGLPEALRVGAKATPEALARGAKALPGATARGTASGASSTVHSISGLAAISATDKAGIHTAPGHAASAFLQGTGKAIDENPGGVAKTTLRSLPGFITGPASLALAAGESGLQGSPKPLESTASNLKKGTFDILGKLASGDEKKVQKAVEQEVGVTPFIPVPAVLRKLHGSDLYQAPRGAVRKSVESHRQAGREAPTTEAGMRYQKSKEPKPPVPVSAKPGEHYVFRGIGSKLEAGKARREVALDTSRASAYGETHGHLEAGKIIAAAHRHGTVSGLAKKMGPEYEASLWPMAKMGIPHGEKGAPLMKELADYYGRPDQPPIPGSLTDRMAANAAAENPGLFEDKAHAAMAQATRESQGRLAKTSSHSSERAARIPQNDFTNHLRAKEGKPPILKPEERITKQAENFTSTEEAASALRSKADKLEARAGWKKTSENKAAGLRSEAEGLRAEADHVLKGGIVSRRGAWEHYQQLNAEYDRLRKSGAHDAAASVLKQKKGLYKELKQYTHPDNSLDGSTLKGWNRAMVRDFTRQQDAEAAGRGMHKGVYVADKAPASQVNKAAMVERPFSSRATHVKTGELAKSGEAEARFETGLVHSVLSPRTRMAYNELVHNTLNEGKIPVRVGKTYKHVLTESELERAVRNHSLPADSVAIDLGVIKQALVGEHALTHEGVSSLLDGMAKGDAAQALKDLPADLKDEVLAAPKKGRKYAVVSRARVEELVEQFAAPKHPNWRKAASVPARVVLNDPAWVLSQLFATGIPIAASIGPSALLHAPRAIKIMDEIQRKADPETQARIAAMVGSSAGVWGVPEGAFRPASDPFSNVRAIRGSSAGRKLWKLANGEVMGKWDRWNNAKMREFAAAVRASKGFRNWYGGFKGLNKDMARVAEATKGMDAAKRLDYVSRDPVFARSLQRDLNRMGGNWNSFTALERKIAPFTMFYPWIRYSLDWTFHVFPLHHPVAATALAMLGQVNANGLQKIAAAESKGTGAKVKPNELLSNPLEYAYPVTYTGDKAKVYPLGGRIAPTLGVGATTLLSGQPSNALQAVNPILGTGISLATNRNLFTGQELEGSIPQELGNQMYNFSPALRAASAAVGFRGFGKGPQSAISKAYEEANPGKTVRSVGLPTIPQSARNFALTNALSKVENTISNTSSSEQAKVQGDETRPTKERQKIVARMKKEEGEALDSREKILRAINPKLAKQANEEYERYKVSGQEPNSGSIYGKKATETSIYSPSSTSSSIYGSGSNKALNYKPPKEELHLPGGLNIPGLGKTLGAIGTPLASLIGGEKAQAAQKPVKTAHANKVVAAKLTGWGLDPHKVGVLRKVEKETGVPAQFLASISKTESTNGTSTLPGVHSGQNEAGAAGPFQMGNGTGAAGDAWQTYAAKIWGKNAAKHSVYNYPDAARAAAEYLKEAGVTKNPSTWTTGALAYNHSSSYASEVAGNAQAASALPWSKASAHRGPAFIPGKGRYAFPFAQGWTESRTDMGKDYAYTHEGAPVRALGSGTVVAPIPGEAHWEGGNGLVLKLDHSKGLPSPYVFLYEGINPTVQPGQRVKKGQVIAKGGITGSIETGFSNAEGVPLAAGEYAEDGTETKYGKVMSNFLGSLAKGKTKIPARLLHVGGGHFTTSSGALTPEALTTYAAATGTPAKTVAKQLKTGKLKPETLLQKLAKVERALGSKLTPLGLPGLGTASPGRPSVSSIAALGKSLEASRQELAAL